MVSSEHGSAPDQSAEHVNHLGTLQAQGNPGQFLSEIDRRIFPRQPPLWRNPACVPGKIVDLLVDEGILHPEWGRFSDLERWAVGETARGVLLHYGRSARSPA